jgi:hypothetical protein
MVAGETSMAIRNGQFSPRKDMSDFDGSIVRASQRYNLAVERLLRCLFVGFKHLDVCSQHRQLQLS